MGRNFSLAEGAREWDRKSRSTKVEEFGIRRRNVRRQRECMRCSSSMYYCIVLSKIDVFVRKRGRNARERGGNAKNTREGGCWLEGREGGLL